MKISLFFLVAAPVLILSNSAKADFQFFPKFGNLYFKYDTEENENRPANHLNNHYTKDNINHPAIRQNNQHHENLRHDNQHVSVRTHRIHKVHDNLEKDITKVVVEDDNGNVQESTRIILKKLK